MTHLAELEVGGGIGLYHLRYLLDGPFLTKNQPSRADVDDENGTEGFFHGLWREQSVDKGGARAVGGERSSEEPGGEVRQGGGGEHACLLVS